MNLIPARVRLGVVCLLLILAGNSVHAQLSTNFSSTAPTGCSPLVVHFTDQSAGNPTSWRWDLGNGTISTLQNPTATYFNPGSYAVKLVVRNSSGADSVIKQQYVTVFPKPVVAFTADQTSGCFPHTVQFTDQSIPSSGTITSWAWDFGDGTTSTAANPAHTYTIAGNFTVTLQVTNSNGCTALLTKQQYITITDGVTADFTNTTAGTCETTPTIQFTSTSTGPGNLSYEWSFGDGGVSALPSPSHTYTATGSYTVTLIVISPQGCRDTIQKENLISVGTLHSQFTAPDEICAGTPFTLTNTTTPAPGTVLWYFGDGTTSTDSNPTKTYSTPGTYTIKLVNDFGGCKDSTTKDILVKPQPVADFTVAKNTGCQVPFTASFTSQATGTNTYQWNFGDGGVSTDANPVHVYTTPGSYTVVLTVTGANGCSATVTKADYIVIEIPTIQVEGFPQTGCLPLTVNPTATVTANEPVVSYQWNFGDGGTGTTATPQHTYTQPGTYDVSVTITTQSGCTQTLTIPVAVRTGRKPSANFTVNPNDVCASQPVQFTDASTGDIDQWFWQFGDGGTSGAQNPLYQYSDTGYFNVTLVVWSNTCPDTIRYNQIVHIKPPIARFDVTNNCETKYTKRFTDRSIGAETWAWDFGDGTTSTDQHPTHNYATTGVYTVTLTVTNGSCRHQTSRQVRVIDEKAKFSPDQSPVCRNTLVTFSAPTITAANISGWQWDFGDGSPASGSPVASSHSYTTAGRYKVLLTITDLLGCVDTTSRWIDVYGAKAGFTAAVPSSCLGSGPVTFTDQSVTDGTHPIVKWEWDFGDGTVTTTPPPFEHVYTATGTYTVTLTVTDAFGCVDKIVKTEAIIIAKPKADFYSPDTVSCVGKPISFINGSTGSALQHTWNFGDNTGSTDINPVHAYSAVGLYTIKLLVTDQYGCKDSLTRPDYINISLPKAGFKVSDSVSTCPPLEVVFTNTATNYRSVSWDFGDGNTSVLDNPTHTYTSAGVFFAVQTVTGPGGCQDRFTQRIEVKGPSGSFSFAPGIGCNPLTVTFTATTRNNASFLWDFTDGTTEASIDPVITHTYTTPGDYVPRMILIDAGGCRVPIVGPDTIHVTGLKVDFDMDANRFCNAGAVNFSNTTVSNDYITGWLWHFGDGTTSTDQFPQHSYSTPGIYSVKLEAVTQSGCKDSLILTDTIYVFTNPVVGIQGDNSSCVPAAVSFAATATTGNAATMNWQWDMGNGQTAVSATPPEQLYPNAGTYTIVLSATDENNCRATANHQLTVHPLPNTEAGPDRVVCLGTPIQLQATGAATYLWDAAPSLSCDDCPGPLANPADNMMYFVEGTSEFGCRKRDSLSVRVRKPFAMTTGPGDTLCLGETARLHAAGAELYRWTPAATLSSAASPDPVANPVATTTYEVIGADTDNCFSDTANILVKVYPIPSVEAGADQTIAVGSSAQLQATGSADITGYQWTPAYNLSCTTCPNPVASPKNTTVYKVAVTNDGGCTSRDEMTVFVVCNNGNLFVPNTFSPDGNGVNEVFYPRGKGLLRIKAFRVFNRWGEMVFERTNFSANDAASGWDGTFKGKKLSPDVFIYTCDVICENNEILQYKGDVTLLR